MENAEPLIKNRNFDPETRTLKKRGNDEDVEMEDTVEKNIEGLAEQIIEEESGKRAQELVSILISSPDGHVLTKHANRICLTSLPRGQTGI